MTTDRIEREQFRRIYGAVIDQTAPAHDLDELGPIVGAQPGFEHEPTIGRRVMTGALAGLALIGVVAIVLSGLRAVGPAGPGDADAEITPFAVLAGPLPDRLAPTLRYRETLVIDHDLVESDDPRLQPPEGTTARILKYATPSGDARVGTHDYRPAIEDMLELLPNAERVVVADAAGVLVGEPLHLLALLPAGSDIMLSIDSSVLSGADLIGLAEAVRFVDEETWHSLTLTTEGLTNQPTAQSFAPVAGPVELAGGPGWVAYAQVVRRPGTDDATGNLLCAWIDLGGRFIDHGCGQEVGGATVAHRHDGGLIHLATVQDEVVEVRHRIGSDESIATAPVDAGPGSPGRAVAVFLPDTDEEIWMVTLDSAGRPVQQIEGMDETPVIPTP